MNREVRNVIGALVLTTAAASAQLQYVTNAGNVSVTITGYTGNVPSALVIPSTIGGLTVTGIADDAFEEFSELNSVEIANTITSLGNFAFSGTGLTNVSIPDSITNIPEAAFGDCGSLTNVSIPDSVVSIGIGAFEGSGLASITIPGSVTNIGFDAVSGCGNLTNVIIAFGVPYIGSDMFSGCSDLLSLTIPASVTNIPDEGLAQCHGLTSVFFSGNAPGAVWSSFLETKEVGGFPQDYYAATAYYLPGTTGWPEFSSNAMIPAVLWNPAIQASDANFGVQSNQFGFDVTGTTNLPIAIEACDDLSQSNWVVLHRVTITNGLFHFSEPFQSNSSARFYRIGFP